MRLEACLAALAMLMVAGSAGADSQPNLPSDPGVAEDVTPLQVVIRGHHYALDALIARKPGAERLPVALITHGNTDGDPRSAGMGWLRGWAHDLANRGWLAVAVMRRGYGRSEGEMFDDAGTCAAPDVGRYLDANADDLAAALQAVALRPDADMGRVIAIGDSAGGAETLDFAGPWHAALVRGGQRLGRPRPTGVAIPPYCPDAMPTPPTWCGTSRASAARRACRRCGCMPRMTAGSGPAWSAGCGPPTPESGGQAELVSAASVRRGRPRLVLRRRRQAAAVA